MNMCDIHLMRENRVARAWAVIFFVFLLTPCSTKIILKIVFYLLFTERQVDEYIKTFK